jgi:mono/diheme cytochrome c family protein
MKHIAYLPLVISALAGLATPARAAEMTGKEVFDHYCTYCHGARDGPGTMQLSRTRGKDQSLLIERTNLSPDYIEYVVRHGLRSMPPFAPSDLTETKLKALAAFLTKSRHVSGHDK